MNKISCILAAGFILGACSGNQGRAAGNTTEPISGGAQHSTPALTADADTLFSYVEQQVALGPRVPASDAHHACRNLIVNRLRQYGIDSIAIQQPLVTDYTGTVFEATNILGCINPDATNRILLLAHYDTRPWADHDPEPALRQTPIDGANDGASGVAVLLETARVAARALPDSIGVDLLFVDLEDSGESGGEDETWCLGTQEWVKDMPYTAANRPRFGILLDMVGGADARFHREYFSDRYAGPQLSRIWAIARESGYGSRFINARGGAVVDDHLFINRAGIPCIDIIESQNPHTGSFNPTWHTTADNLASIDRNTLKAVAQTVLNTITSSAAVK